MTSTTLAYKILGASSGLIESWENLSLRSFWSRCYRADQMLWIAARPIGGQLDWPSRRLLVLAACRCVEFARTFIDCQGEFEDLLAVARQWCDGKAQCGDIEWAVSAFYAACRDGDQTAPVDWDDASRHLYPLVSPQRLTREAAVEVGRSITKGDWLSIHLVPRRVGDAFFFAQLQSLIEDERWANQVRKRIHSDMADVVREIIPADCFSDV